jgi:hypothetical protein
MKFAFLASVTAAIVFSAPSAEARSVLTAATVEAKSAVEPVVCKGNRRNYRDFNHCNRSASGSPKARVAYCSRICG